MGASDVLLSSGAPPSVRLHGALVRLENHPDLDPEAVQGMIADILSDEQRGRLEDAKEVCVASELAGGVRIRASLFGRLGSIAAAVRLIPPIRSIEELGLPDPVADLARSPRGLVVVAGPPASGRSTTLAAMVDLINSERYCHVLTVEDPVEYLHAHKRAVVDQREVGTDTPSVARALEAVPRQDPDVLLIGEIRGRDLIETSISLAEGRYLVLTAFVAQDGPQAVDRIVGSFPEDQRDQARARLGPALLGIITQRLLPAADGKGQVLACEVLIVTAAVRNLIRQTKVEQLYSLMQGGAARGMQPMDSVLGDLVGRGAITAEAARTVAVDPDRFEMLAHDGPATGR